MTLQLTEQQLKEAADQLELTVDQVRKLYEAASGAGTQLKSVNEFVELVEKETKKVASTTATDEKSAGKVPGKKKPPYLGTESDTEETDEEKMTTKEELADVIRDLTTEERKELRTMLDGVDEADAAGTLALHREVTSLKEMVTTTTAQVNALVAALASNGLQQTQKASSGDSNEAIQTALREILQSAPRAAFVSQRHKESDATEVVDDESIQAELKEIKEQLKQIAPPNGKQLYSLFTSETLNRRSGARK